jgi:hypothetical protein
MKIEEKPLEIEKTDVEKLRELYKLYYKDYEKS